MRLLLIFLLVISVSCSNSKREKKIVTTNDAKQNMALEKDSTLIEVADIPIHIDSTRFLIHPIGEYKMYKSRSKIGFGSSSYGKSGSFNISSFNRYQINGDLLNIKFESLDTGNITSLTNSNIRIQTITFLRDIYNSKQEQFLVYKVIDKDTNLDKKLDNNDVKSLYMSAIDGSNFIKLTEEFHELIDWKVITVNNKLYFRSLEDSNNNGEFDNKDQIHYHVVDFNATNRKVTRYNPI
ncbi:hypothetical protein [Lacinutrix salivirga]